LNKFCPCNCKYFTRAYVGIPIFFENQFEGRGSILPQRGREWEGQSIVTFRHCFKNIASYSSTPVPWFYQHVPAPPRFYQQNSSTFLNFPKISWSEFSFVLSSKVRISVFHCHL
jgi:hypothetical protein